MNKKEDNAVGQQCMDRGKVCIGQSRVGREGVWGGREGETEGCVCV